MVVVGVASGDTHAVEVDGGADCPGIATVPAHPKFVYVANKVTEPPSR